MFFCIFPLFFFMFPMFLCDFYTVFMDISNVSVDFLWIFQCFFFDFSNVFPLFLWLVPMTPSDGPGGNRYPLSPNCNTVHNPAKPPSRNTLSPRGERDLRTTVQLCPPDPLFSLRSHKATSQPAGLPFVITRSRQTNHYFCFGWRRESSRLVRQEVKKKRGHLFRRMN